MPDDNGMSCACTCEPLARSHTLTHRPVLSYLQQEDDDQDPDDDAAVRAAGMRAAGLESDDESHDSRLDVQANTRRRNN